MPWRRLRSASRIPPVSPWTREPGRASGQAEIGPINANLGVWPAPRLHRGPPKRPRSPSPSRQAHRCHRGCEVPSAAGFWVLKARAAPVCAALSENRESRTAGMTSSVGAHRNRWFSCAGLRDSAPVSVEVRPSALHRSHSITVRGSDPCCHSASRTTMATVCAGSRAGRAGKLVGGAVHPGPPS